jgi:hypothetical protein
MSRCNAEQALKKRISKTILPLVKLHLEFYCKSHILKNTQKIWNKYVLKTGQAKYPGTTQNKTFVKNHITYFTLIEAELRVGNIISL